MVFDGDSNFSIDRRNFLKQGLFFSASVFSNSLFSAFPEISEAKPNDSWDISYLWHHDLETILNYQEEVGNLLGPDVANKLEVVKGSKSFGLIYDRNASSDKATRTALVHNNILIKNGFSGGASPIKDDVYDSVYNISYGVGPNLESLKDQFGVVYNQLGSELGKDLVIEKTKSGKFALVYKRYGDKNSTLDVVRKHSKILRKKGIGVTEFPESNNELVFGESTFLNEQIDSKPTRGFKILSEDKKKKVISRNSDVDQNLKEIVVLKDSKKIGVSKSSSSSSSEHGRLSNYGIEEIIESFVKRERRRGRVKSSERTSFCVYDLSTDEYVLDINSSSPRQCASMCKPFIALANFHKIKTSGRKYDSNTRRKMERMIQKSDNRKTTELMKKVGDYNTVQNILISNYPEIFKQTSIVEYIPANGQTYRNKSSARDYIRFLSALWKNELPYSMEIKRLMALPGRDRIYNGAKDIPTGTLIYNKTGTTGLLCGDMGIVYAKSKSGDRKAYAFVGIVERDKKRGSYANWSSRSGNLIRGVSNRVYNVMKKRHNLI